MIPSCAEFLDAGRYMHFAGKRAKVAFREIAEKELEQFKSDIRDFLRKTAPTVVAPPTAATAATTGAAAAPPPLVVNVVNTNNSNATAAATATATATASSTMFFDSGLTCEEAQKVDAPHPEADQSSIMAASKAEAEQDEKLIGKLGFGLKLVSCDLHVRKEVESLFIAMLREAGICDNAPRDTGSQQGATILPETIDWAVGVVYAVGLCPSDKQQELQMQGGGIEALDYVSLEGTSETDVVLKSRDVFAEFIKTLQRANATAKGGGSSYGEKFEGGKKFDTTKSRFRAHLGKYFYGTGPPNFRDLVPSHKNSGQDGRTDRTVIVFEVYGPDCTEDGKLMVEESVQGGPPKYAKSLREVAAALGVSHTRTQCRKAEGWTYLPQQDRLTKQVGAHTIHVQPKSDWTWINS
eukprot:SAG31_NODE_6192_length_2128_cov_8.444061_1_plen_409_part_00